MKKGLFITALVLALLAVAAYTQLTIFVIQPIGALPEGRTLVIPRLNKTKFIDSADAMCVREMGGVSLLCRMAAMGAVVETAKKPLLTLPYSKTLYLWSTDGKTYDR